MWLHEIVAKLVDKNLVAGVDRAARDHFAASILNARGNFEIRTAADPADSKPENADARR